MCDTKIHSSNSLQPSKRLISYELRVKFLLELYFFTLDMGFPSVEDAHCDNSGH